MFQIMDEICKYGKIDMKTDTVMHYAHMDGKVKNDTLSNVKEK